MTTDHNQLKEYGKQVLLKLGFEHTEIIEEYNVSYEGMRERLLVDIAGISHNRKVAIECGNTPSDKVIKLQMYFDEVILLPYLKSKVSDLFVGTEKNMAITITQQEKQIAKLLSELTALKKEYEQQKKELNSLKNNWDNQDYHRREMIGAITLVYLDMIGCLPSEARCSVWYLESNLRRKVVQELNRVFSSYGANMAEVEAEAEKEPHPTYAGLAEKMKEKMNAAKIGVENQQ